jgi:hypothetical protein
MNGTRPFSYICNILIGGFMKLGQWLMSAALLSIASLSNAQSREEVMRKIAELQDTVGRTPEVSFDQLQELDSMLDDALGMFAQPLMIHCSDTVNFTRDPAYAFSFYNRLLGRQNSDGCLYYTTARYNNPAVLKATYSFNNLRRGSYKVGLSWVFGDPNRASRIPVEIYDGWTLVKTTFINQQPQNAGISQNGIVFTEVARDIPVRSGQLRVVVRNDVDAENNGKFIDFHSALVLPQRGGHHHGR